MEDESKRDMTSFLNTRIWLLYVFDGAGEELALFKRSGKEVGVVWCDFSAAKKFKILGKAVSFLSVN